jgi:hypothetical protein
LQAAKQVFKDATAVLDVGIGIQPLDLGGDVGRVIGS